MLSLKELLERDKDNLKIYNNFSMQADKDLTKKLTICIPDLHLLDNGQRDDFKQNKERFLGFLKFLYDLKKQEGDNLEVIQLGDMYDLWQADGDILRILSVYEDMIGLLEEIKPIFVVGNHDIDLIKSYKGKPSEPKLKYNSKIDGELRIVYEHGFRADFFNNQNSWSGEIGEGITKIVGMMEDIEPDIDVILGNAWDDIRDTFKKYSKDKTPVKNPSGFNQHEYHNFYVRQMGKNNFNLSVIGHTHSATLVKIPKDGKTLFLMDCGSWVNEGHEIGVISGKEMAVCQWG